MTMTATRSSSELADAPCSVGECLEPAVTLATATVSIGGRTVAPPDFHTLAFGLPLCENHAVLLRQGCRLVDFHSGL